MTNLHCPLLRQISNVSDGNSGRLLKVNLVTYCGGVVQMYRFGVSFVAIIVLAQFLLILAKWSDNDLWLPHSTADIFPNP